MKFPITIEKTIITETIERTEKERIVRRITAIAALIAFFFAFAWILNQPMEFQADISLNNQLIGAYLNGLPPHAWYDGEQLQYKNASFNLTSDGQTTISIKWKGPVFTSLPFIIASAI